MSEMENKKETREGKLTTGETLGAVGALIGTIAIGVGGKIGFDKIKAKVKAKKEAKGDAEPKDNVITKLKDKIETKKAEKEQK